MKNKIKSIQRRLKRGHLRIKTEVVPLGFGHNSNGVLELKTRDVPYLESRNSHGRWSRVF